MSKREKFLFIMFVLAWSIAMVFGTLAVQEAIRKGLFK